MKVKKIMSIFLILTLISGSMQAQRGRGGGGGPRGRGGGIGAAGGRGPGMGGMRAGGMGMRGAGPAAARPSGMGQMRAPQAAAMPRGPQRISAPRAEMPSPAISRPRTGITTGPRQAFPAGEISRRRITRPRTEIPGVGRLPEDIGTRPGRPEISRLRPGRLEPITPERPGRPEGIPPEKPTRPGRPEGIPPERPRRPIDRIDLEGTEREVGKLQDAKKRAAERLRKEQLDKIGKEKKRAADEKVKKEDVGKKRVAEEKAEKARKERLDRIGERRPRDQERLRELGARRDKQISNLAQRQLRQNPRLANKFQAAKRDPLLRNRWRRDWRRFAYYHPFLIGLGFDSFLNFVFFAPWFLFPFGYYNYFYNYYPTYWVDYGQVSYPIYWDYGYAQEIQLVQDVQQVDYDAAINKLETRLDELENQILQETAQEVQAQISEIVWLLNDLKKVILEDNRVDQIDQTEKDRLTARIDRIKDRAHLLLPSAESAQEE